MEEKAPLLPEHTPSTDPDTTTPLPGSRRTSWFQMAGVTLLLSLFWLATTWSCPGKHQHLDVATKVPLDVHIMSKCPDARDCLQKLVLPAMANVSDKVDFRLSMIGR